MELTDLIIIYLYSYFPAIMLGLFFWWMDRFERENFLLVFAAFIWGAFGAGILSYFWNTFFHILLTLYQQNSDVVNDMLVTVVVAPFVEEITKGAVILLFLRLKQVDNVTDGIVLGVIIGLGFAASENVHYALEVIYPSSGALAMWHNLWFREIHTTLLHASATAIWGGMIGYSRNFKRFQRLFVIIVGFVLASGMHGFWNFMATYVNSIQTSFNIIELIMRLELFLIFGILITLFLASVFNQSQIIITELKEEYLQGVIPEEHIGYFASLVRHPKKYNLPPQCQTRQYAILGVRLAFRKHEYKINPSEALQTEIQDMRAQLRHMLAIKEKKEAEKE